MKGENSPLEFLLSNINVPAIRKTNQITSIIFNDSPRNRKANIATNPGVNARRGRALLISRFFSDSITKKNAATPIIDLISKTKRLIEFIV